MRQTKKISYVLVLTFYGCDFIGNHPHLQEVSPPLPPMGDSLASSTVTQEYVPAGRGLPSWLIAAYSEGPAPNFLLLHPNELHRRHLLDQLQRSGYHVSPQHHMTLNQLIRTLHTDLRLPVLLDNDTSSSMALHSMCLKAAESYDFPLLHTPGATIWSFNKSQRLHRLFSEVMHLRKPFNWDGNPGLETYRDLLREFEQQAGGSHPTMVPRHVLNELQSTDEVPFHVRHLDGIIILDQAPDFTEIEQDILLSLSRFCPMHQLLNPGSFRLGHHGAYLIDQDPVAQDTLPGWVPQHDLWNGPGQIWNTEISEEHQTQRTRLPVDQRHQIIPATMALLGHYLEGNEGRVLIVDGAVQERELAWSSGLAGLGLAWRRSSSTLDRQPAHHALLQAAQLPQGMSAWSIEALRSTFASTTLPFNPDMYVDLLHPSQESWRPRPHLDILESMAERFHVLGGPGALARWLGVLSQARPSLTERRPEEKRQALEETQWWLACTMKVWKPLLMEEDQHLLRYDIEGCSTGEVLPTPSSPSSGMAWLTQVIRSLDFESLHQRRAPHDSGLGTVQTLVDALNDVRQSMLRLGATFPDDGKAFVDLIEFVGESTRIQHSESSTPLIDVITPEEALGCEADLIVLAGLDVDSWPMKSPVVPWLDAKALLELGIFQTDGPIRKGRHHLRHLFNAAPHIVVFDSSPEEGGGPSAPLAEWLSDVRRTKEWDTMRSPPSFLPPSTYEGSEAAQPWRWVVRERGHGSWLSPQQYSFEHQAQSPRLVRHGHQGRDRRQQLGLDLTNDQPVEASPINADVILQSFEPSIQADRQRRQPQARHLGAGGVFGWDQRQYLLSTEAVILRPTKASLKAGGSSSPVWPHLGFKDEKKLSPSVDPRPLPVYVSEGLGLVERFGHIEHEITRKTWSPSRLEAWLKCPRQAWAKQVLKADDEAGESSEDVNLRIRGEVVHQAEAALLEGHGIEVTKESLHNIQPLHLGPMGVDDAGWQTILQFLQNDVLWLGRHNAVSVHRTRDLVDASAEDWRAYLEGEVSLPASGRLARMLHADLSLRQAAPIASEWATVKGREKSVTIALDEEDTDTKFQLFGFADRVDVFLPSTSQRKELEESGILGETSFDTPYPLDGTPRTAQRLVIIRDLKTVHGPKPKSGGLRHARSLFEDLQLALYARAWEVLHPNDRVIGVGASEIGENTVHYVELDSDLIPLREEMEIGEITDYFPLQFPALSDEHVHRTPFRTWLHERLIVAQRAVVTAASGQVNPTPGQHCDYCSLSHSCAVSTYSGGGF